MRFRYLLPATELFIVGVLVSTSLHRCLPYYRMRNADGIEMKGIEGPSSTSCMGHVPELAQAINLPAAIIVSPMLLAKSEYSNDGHDWIHDPIWRSLGYTVIGVVAWFFVGRLLDDFIARRKTLTWHRVHISDIVFSASTLLVALLAVAASIVPHDSHGMWFLFSGSIWLLVGSAGVTFRSIQIVVGRRKAR